MSGRGYFYSRCKEHNSYYVSKQLEVDCPYCEIDRLKAELADTIKYCKPYGGNPRVCTGMQAHKDLERQLDTSQALLDEARAENERLNSVDHYACALCPDVKQARQEAARECLETINFGINEQPLMKGEVFAKWLIRNIKAKFKLEE